MNIIEKTDLELKNDVLSELKYEPSVRVADIGVLVNNGTVTLNGYATSYGEKWVALHAAKRVAGVTAIADDIEVQLPNSIHHTDSDIAASAARQIDSSTVIPKKTVRVLVSKNWVTLEGEVEWWHLKEAAEKSMRSIPGVLGVSNLILIKPVVSADEVERLIKAAFERNAVLDADLIQVNAKGSDVVLRGKVRNLAAKDEAERVAWNAPGVSSVDNEISVKWSWSEN